MVGSEAMSNPGSADSVPSTEPEKLTRHHVSNILDDVLGQQNDALDAPKHGNKHPFAIDIVIGFGLLVAVAGFTSGLMKMYLAHSAENCLTNEDYQGAIALLKGSEGPSLFASPSQEPRELLNRAYYLDAVQKLAKNQDDPGALKELEKIMPDSDFFDFSQQLLREHSTPAAVTLEGGATQSVQVSNIETPSPAPVAEPNQ